MSASVSKAPETRSTIEGGPFHCGIHDFRTTVLDEWTQHCKETLHTMFGGAPCIFCKTAVYYDSLPHVGPGENPGAVCDNCFDNFVVPRQKRIEEAKAAKSLQQGQQGQQQQGQGQQ